MADWLHPSAQYHDFVAWSIYPAGRKDTVDDPPSTGRRSTPLTPTWRRTATWSAASSGSSGPRRRRDAPIGVGQLHVGETGTGDDPDDSDHQAVLGRHTGSCTRW